MNTNRKFKNLARKSHGQSMVEVAMTLPLLLVVGFIITEFGRALWVKNVLTQACREAAREACVESSAACAGDRASRGGAVSRSSEHGTCQRQSGSRERAGRPEPDRHPADRGDRLSGIQLRPRRHSGPAVRPRERRRPGSNAACRAVRDHEHGSDDVGRWRQLSGVTALLPIDSEETEASADNRCLRSFVRFGCEPSVVNR